MLNIYKGISFPFRFDSRGGVTTSVLSPQDFTRIEESIKTIISTRVRERHMLPEFGANTLDYIFESMDDVSLQAELADELKNALERNDDRITVIGTTFQPVNEGALEISVDVQITRLQINQTISTILQEGDV